jgi:urea transport system permease protein
VRQRLAGSGLLVAAVFLPWVLSPFQASLAAKALTFALFALGLDLVWGLAGILSFGHAAFFGVGAYALGIVTRAWPDAGAVGLSLAVALPAILALGLGYFAFYGGVSGAHFAIITLALSLILTQVAQTWVGLTGGHNGLYPVPFLALRVPGVGGPAFDSEMETYYLALGFVVATFLLLRWLGRSAFGQALMAMAEDEGRLRFLGYDTRRLRLAAFTLSGAVAGLGGGLYASQVGFVNPAVVGVALSTQVIVWVALGGRGTLVGAVCGALVLAFTEDLLSDVLVNIWVLALGVLVLLVALFRPEGLLGSPKVRRFVGLG